jgi:purine nucleosidase
VQQSLPPDSKPRGLMHDSCVTAFLVAPELFAGRDVHVAVETTSELTMGKSVVDWWGVTKREPNARVLDRIDVESFFELITERMGRLP